MTTMEDAVSSVCLVALPPLGIGVPVLLDYSWQLMEGTVSVSVIHSSGKYCMTCTSHVLHMSLLWHIC